MYFKLNEVKMCETKTTGIRATIKYPNQIMKCKGMAKTATNRSKTKTSYQMP